MHPNTRHYGKQQNYNPKQQRRASGPFQHEQPERNESFPTDEEVHRMSDWGRHYGSSFGDHRDRNPESTNQPRRMTNDNRAASPEHWAPNRTDFRRNAPRYLENGDRGQQSEFGAQGRYDRDLRADCGDWNDRFANRQGRYDRDVRADRGDLNDRFENRQSRGYPDDLPLERQDWNDRDIWRTRELNGWQLSALPRHKEFIGKGPKGYSRSDANIQEEVSQRLSHGYLDASDIEVTVKDGEVILQGTVASKQDRRLAEDLIEDCFGVSEVDNRLKLKRSRSPDTAEDMLTSSKESKSGAISMPAGQGSSKRIHN